MWPELKYSFKWKKGKHVAAYAEVDASDVEIDEELAPAIAPVSTSFASSKPPSDSQARLVEHLDDGTTCLDKHSISWKPTGNSLISEDKAHHYKLDLLSQQQ